MPPRTCPFSGRRRRVVLGTSLMMSTTAMFFVSIASSISSSTALVSVPKQHGVPNRNQYRTSLPLDHVPAATSSLDTTSKSRASLISPTVCFYADEWFDADIELAFHNSGSGGDSTQSTAAAPKTTTEHSNKQHASSSSSSLFRRVCIRLSRKLYQLKERIRMTIERCTVYVLECEEGKYYVGSTTNRKRRFREHTQRKGSKWTRAYKPLRVLKEYRRIPSKFLLGMESKVTAECMLEYGVNNVRGSMFCSPRDYHMGDIDSLTKFLGHYNDLNYRKVNLRLSQTLPVSPATQRKRNNYAKIMDGKCFTCGKAGHFAASCPEKKGMTTSSTKPTSLAP